MGLLAIRKSFVKYLFNIFPIFNFFCLSLSCTSFLYFKYKPFVSVLGSVSQKTDSEKIFMQEVYWECSWEEQVWMNEKD